MRLLQRPIVRFLMLGGLLFAAERWRSPGVGEELIEIRAGEVEQLRHDWTARLGREPSDPELDGLASSLIDEEVLVREAIRLGLDRSDPIVHRRLITNLRFLAGDAAAGDDELLRDAYALGLQRSDVVVRRRLVQAVEQRLQAAGHRDPPSDRELEEEIARHPERFEVPARVRFTHLLVSTDRHGRDAERVARSVRSSLITDRQGPEAAERYGDPFLLGNHPGPMSEQAIAGAFGAEFARGIAALAPGSWSEPIHTAFGEHLVWVEEKVAARRPLLSEVRERALLSVLTERKERARNDGVVALRSRYRIRVEGPTLTRRSIPEEARR